MTSPLSHPHSDAQGGILEDSSRPVYKLSLFISGITPRSRLAIVNVKRLCEEELKGRYTLEVIDIYQQPHLARANQIIAAPTLIKRSPLPLCRLVGDLSDETKVRQALDLDAS